MSVESVQFSFPTLLECAGAIEVVGRNLSSRLSRDRNFRFAVEPSTGGAPKEISGVSRYSRDHHEQTEEMNGLEQVREVARKLGITWSRLTISARDGEICFCISDPLEITSLGRLFQEDTLAPPTIAPQISTEELATVQKFLNKKCECLGLQWIVKEHKLTVIAPPGFDARFFQNLLIERIGFPQAVQVQSYPILTATIENPLYIQRLAEMASPAVQIFDIAGKLRPETSDAATWCVYCGVYHKQDFPPNSPSLPILPLLSEENDAGITIRFPKWLVESRNAIKPFQKLFHIADGDVELINETSDGLRYCCKLLVSFERISEFLKTI